MRERKQSIEIRDAKKGKEEQSQEYTTVCILENITTVVCCQAVVVLVCLFVCPLPSNLSMGSSLGGWAGWACSVWECCRTSSVRGVQVSRAT